VTIGTLNLNSRVVTVGTTTVIRDKCHGPSTLYRKHQHLNSNSMIMFVCVVKFRRYLYVCCSYLSM